MHPLPLIPWLLVPRPPHLHSHCTRICRTSANANQNPMRDPLSREKERRRHVPCKSSDQISGDCFSLSLPLPLSLHVILGKRLREWRKSPAGRQRASTSPPSPPLVLILWQTRCTNTQISRRQSLRSELSSTLMTNLTCERKE